MQTERESFHALLGIKTEPNSHEKYLFERAKTYIQKLSNIPGIHMIAIVNSLSMNATHKNSDIDLFIVTQSGMIWFVRFLATLILWKHGVWRKNTDIAEHFCLSFFVTTEGLDLSAIAIPNDIYLYYWIYYLKPILVRQDSYNKFLEANDWVNMDTMQRLKNQEYLIPQQTFREKKNRTRSYQLLNRIIRVFLLPRTLKTYSLLGKPEGVIISDTMLKFHDRDKRRTIRDAIFDKNFDK